MRLHTIGAHAPRPRRAHTARAWEILGREHLPIVELIDRRDSAFAALARLREEGPA